MRLFLDTEFNEFGGELISMALVSDAGDEWYQVRELTTAPGEWVDAIQNAKHPDEDIKEK